jgi:hypothetical protein
MDINDLRLYGYHYVAESDIDFNTKINLLEFVREASHDEILSLLATGKTELYEDRVVLDTMEMVISEDIGTWRAARAGKKAMKQTGGNPLAGLAAGMHKYVQHHKQMKVARGVGVTAILAALAVAAAKFAKASKKLTAGCKELKGQAEQNCIMRNDIKITQQKIRLYQSGMSKCAGTKNPEICRAKIQLKIKKLENKIAKKRKINSSQIVIGGT